MKTIYISGKIDGCDEHGTFRKFMKAHRQLLNIASKGDTPDSLSPLVINPLAIKDIPNGTWFDYMMRDLVYLKHCDTIYMPKDWKDSAGARMEHEFAKKLGLEIIYEEGEQ